jgi:cytochrome d ubiquinol oxidase subunit I
MDAELLARLQFALTISFHYIFPPMSIGLGLIMVLFEGAYLKTRKKEYETLAKFWTKIFGIIFGMGVVTGIVMEFEFGTNWATYSRYVGDVFGSALAAEGLFAFALESGFLGLLLFGWNRVKPPVHFIATLAVLIGSMFSAVWIVVANSWMQTPDGYHIVGEGLNARAEIVDFWQLVFNPSSVSRLIHVWNGAFLTGAFFVMSVSAWYIIKGRHLNLAKKSFTVALVIGILFSVIQLFSGHKSVEIVGEYQPTKFAAMEGHYSQDNPADVYIMGFVNEEKEETKGIKLPGLISNAMMANIEKPVKGINDFPKEETPKGLVNEIFQFYHLMVGAGMLMLLLVVMATFFRIRGTLFNQKWLLWLFIPAVVLPHISNQLGWFTAEVGRQPWIVYGMLKTSDAISKTVEANQILFSVIMFSLVYLLLTFLFFYLLTKKIQKGPDSSAVEIPGYSKRIQKN